MSPPGEGADLARRRFFRQFAGDLFHGAAGVVGAAQALQRVSAEAAGAILDPSSVAIARRRGRARPSPRTRPASGRRSARPRAVLHLVDQRKLPDVLEEYRVRSASEAAYAIREMIVRGAPAIGQVGAIGLTLTADKARTTRPYARRATFRGAAKTLINARPTAVNLRWAVERVMAAYEAVGDLSEDGDAIADAMRAEADTIVFETTEDHGRLALTGLDALEALGFPEDRPLRILTHCNTGPLACGQYGTALGVVQAAHHGGRAVHVWVDETRPYLQGARLTAWELAQAGVPHTLIPDVAAGHLMATGEVDVVLVGADRIAANGDTANKVGTYTLAVLAAPPRHPVLRRGADQHGGPRNTGRWRDPDRGAQGERGPVRAWREHRSAGHGCAEPGIRRDAVGPHHGLHQRRGRDPGPVRRWPGRGGGPTGGPTRGGARVRSAGRGRHGQPRRHSR